MNEKIKCGTHLTELLSAISIEKELNAVHTLTDTNSQSTHSQSPSLRQHLIMNLGHVRCLINLSAINIEKELNPLLALTDTKLKHAN